MEQHEAQESKHDKEWLEGRWWFRFLKVVYSGAYILAGFFVLLTSYHSRPVQNNYGYGFYSSGSWKEAFLNLIIGTAVVFCLFEIIKRAFFYITIRERFFQRSISLDFSSIKRNALRLIYRINWKIATTVLIVFSVALFWGILQSINKKAEIERLRIQTGQQLEIKRLQQQKEIQDAKLQADQVKRDADAKLEQQKQEAARANQISLDNCLSSVSRGYTNSWNIECQNQADMRESDYNKCVKDGQRYNYVPPHDEAYCRDEYPILPSSECRLPTYTADRIENSRKSNNADCYTRFGSQ